MKSRSISHDSNRTPYIQLDTKKCIACWKCLAECKNGVIGRINLPWHKHSRFVNSRECTGCLTCIKVCNPGALTKISIKKPDNNFFREKLKLAFIVNLGLLIFGLAMSVSGFAIQFGYHIGHNQGIESENSVKEVGYYIWSDIHKISIVIVSILVTYHFFLHWKWDKTIIIKKLVAKNKLQILLSTVFILVAITGLIPWIMELSGGSEIAGKSFIEVHDKIAILLFVLLIIHVTDKLKWYTSSFDRLKNKQSK